MTTYWYDCALYSQGLVYRMTEEHGCLLQCSHSRGVVCVTSDARLHCEMRGVVCSDFPVNQYTLPQVWEGVKKQVDYAVKQREVEEFNRSHAWLKRGVAMTPTRYTHVKSKCPVLLWQLLTPLH